MRVGDAAEEIRGAHRAAERAWQQADAEREGARDGGKDLPREPLGFRNAGVLPRAPRFHWRSSHDG